MKLMIVVSGGVVQDIVATGAMDIYLVDHDNLKEGVESIEVSLAAEQPYRICSEYELLKRLDEELAEYQDHDALRDYNKEV